MHRLHEAIALFNGGQFFVCHEVLEEEWRAATGPRRLFLQSLIHFAVACYHLQRANRIGAERQLRKALTKLEPYQPVYEGIDTGRLYADFLPFAEALAAEQPCRAFPLIQTVE